MKVIRGFKTKSPSCSFIPSCSFMCAFKTRHHPTRSQLRSALCGSARAARSAGAVLASTATPAIAPAAMR